MFYHVSRAIEMKWMACVKNASQMGRNRAFSPLRQEEVATWAPWRQRILQVIRRSPLGRHGDRKSPKASGRSPLGGRHGDLPLQMATSLKQGKVATYGRHGDLDVASGDLFSFCWLPLMVAMATSRCKWRPLHHLLMVATC